VLIQYDNNPLLNLMMLHIGLKSVMNQTDPSFLGILKVGAPHVDLFTPFLSTPTVHNHSTSAFKVALCILGTGYGLAW
jgi:hypothetical protein